MKRFRIASLVVILAVIAGVASFVLPVPSNNANNGQALSFYAYMGMTAMLAVLYVGASLIFLLSLKGFTKSLKQTYAFICFGFILLGLAFIQLPLLVYGGAVEQLFRGGSLAAGFFFIAFIAIIIGTRRFAKLFGVHSLVTKWWFIFIPPLILSVLYGLLPHVPTGTDELVFDGTNAFNILNAWIDTMALTQILQIKRVAGVQYTRALAWMIISFILQLVAVCGYLATVLPFGDKAWFLVGAVPLIPLTLAGVGFVASAQSFSKITGDLAAESLRVITARNFFGKPLKGGPTSSNASSVDIVVYAANFASQPREIDQFLDVVRGITSNMSANDTLSQADEAQLKGAYLAIENYLLTQEKVRTFTKQSLRQLIADGLKITDTQNTFWYSLPA